MHCPVTVRGLVAPIDYLGSGPQSDDALGELVLFVQRHRAYDPSASEIPDVLEIEVSFAAKLFDDRSRRLQPRRGIEIDSSQDLAASSRALL